MQCHNALHTSVQLENLISVWKAEAVNARKAYAGMCSDCYYYRSTCGHNTSPQTPAVLHSYAYLQGCPCSSSLLCRADTDDVMYNHTDCASTWPFITHVPSPGYWYFIHGGAGAIMSRGLMDLTPFERCQEFIRNGPMPRMSGGNK